MNEEKIFDMISLADDEYVLDASHKKRTIRLGKHAVSMLAAALICTVLLACVAAAVVVTNIVHKGSLNDFYESSTVSEMESRGYTVGKSVENGHARLTLDSVMSDNYRCHPVFTLEALDDVTDADMKRLFGEQFDLSFELSLRYADNDEKIYDSLSTSGFSFYGDKNDRSVTLRTEIFYSLDIYEDGKPKTVKIDRTRPLKLCFTQLSADDPQQLHLLDGLEIELPRTEPVKSIKLISDSGNIANISEFGISVDDPFAFDSYIKKPFRDQSDCIRWKDGTETKLYEIGRTGAGSELINGKYMTFIDLRAFIDIEKIDCAIILGEKYRRIS